MKFGAEYNHVYADQLFGFDQFGRWTITGSAASALEVMSLGGPTANRFDVPLTGAATTATYLKQLGNLALDFDTDELAFFAQDSWRVDVHADDQRRPALGGRVQPHARSQQRLHGRARCRASISRSAARSIRRRFRTS